MREIKFRALTYEDNIISNVGIIEFFEDGTIIVNEEIPVKQLMQYTGLHNKNGGEVYEGDILSGEWGDGWIAYCDKCKCFQYIMKDFGCSRCLGDCMWSEAVEDDGKLEVIGSVYSNPELLEEEL